MALTEKQKKELVDGLLFYVSAQEGRAAASPFTILTEVLPIEDENSRHGKTVY